MTTLWTQHPLWHEPVEEQWLRARCHFGGWSLWESHRHVGGEFGACTAIDYGELSLEELCDVVEVTVRGLQSAPGHCL